MVGLLTGISIKGTPIVTSHVNGLIVKSLIVPAY